MRTGRQLSRYDDVAWSSDEEENKTEKVVTPDHISVGQVSVIMKQVLAGLKQMHDLDIVHRDVKPDNLIFSKEEGNEVKYIDFGISK